MSTLVPTGVSAVRRGAIHLGREASKKNVNATLKTGSEELTLFQEKHVFRRPGGVKRIVLSTLFRPRQSDGRAIVPLTKPTIVSRSDALLPISDSTSSVVARTSITTRRKGSERMVVGLGLTTLVSAYVFWQTNREEVFMNKTGRLRTMAVSWETERKLARLMDAATSKDAIEAEFGWVLPETDFRRKEIESIVSHIVRSAEEDFFEVRRKLDWSVVVCENTIPNAFCSLGGAITVFTGLFDLFVDAERSGHIKDARCGLACILAHEIAHGFCRHTVERISWLPLEYPLSWIIEDDRWLQFLLRYVVELPYSRQCEIEADLVGLELMARAGFDPSEVPKYFAMLDATPASLEWLSTHPAGETRAKTMEDRLPEAQALFEIYRYRFSPPFPPGSMILNFFRELLSFGGKAHGRIKLSELADRPSVRATMVHHGLDEEDLVKAPVAVTTPSVRTKKSTSNSFRDPSPPPPPQPSIRIQRIENDSLA